MRVLFIIPAAFNYFADISQAAFHLAEKLQAEGVHVEPFTLQYSQPSREFKKSVGPHGSKQRGFTYKETIPFKELHAALSVADIIHLHIPFLGFGGEILRFKKNNPSVPLVITRYRHVPYQDLFSLFVMGYNAYYGPKLAAEADALVDFSGSVFKKELVKGHFKKSETLTNAESGVQLLYTANEKQPFFIKYLTLLSQHSYF